MIFNITTHTIDITKMNTQEYHNSYVRVSVRLDAIPIGDESNDQLSEIRNTIGDISNTLKSHNITIDYNKTPYYKEYAGRIKVKYIDNLICEIKGDLKRFKGLKTGEAFSVFVQSEAKSKTITG